MNAILVVRPSSLGDIIHALALVADVRAHRRELAIDWVAESGFVSLVELHPGIRRIVPVAFRRWRHGILSTSTWNEFDAFRRALRSESYEAVLDLQEQVKGALIARMARGIRHGPDRASIREPVATLAHDRHHAIDPNQHLVDRCRQLAAAALGYSIEGAPDFGIVAPPQSDRFTAKGPYAVFVHGTSRADKLWPDAHWRSLIARFEGSGVAVFLPWGSDAELERSERLAAGFAHTIVPSAPRYSLPELAGLLARASVVVGVDTGLVHLAAALRTPTISVFVATAPLLCGVGAAGSHARDLGGTERIPTPNEVETLVATMIRR